MTACGRFKESLPIPAAMQVKRLSTLHRKITGNNHRDFYCLNCFRSYATENKLKKHKNICENHDYYYVEMSEEDNNILKYSHGEKYMRKHRLLIMLI